MIQPYRYLRRKHLLVLLLYLSIGFCVFYITFVYTKLNLNSDNNKIYRSQALNLRQRKLQAKNSSSQLLPKILFWTPFFGHYEFMYYGIFPNTFNTCPVKCELTSDKSQLSTSDALIFHARDLTSVPIPTVHDPDQLWIFLNKESPLNTKSKNIKQFKSIFNWTMTYRPDSDIYHPYGQLINAKDNTYYDQQLYSYQQQLQSTQYLTDNKIQSLIKKPKLAAWIVSNCYTHSNRESFVTELQEYIPIDIYGKCGQFSCNSEYADNSHKCYDKISKQYKFYFSFENSLCSDYVTEKFFDALLFDMVPIVYGRANYSLLAPRDSFIDASSFKSTKELADYIIYLTKNHEEYLTYFRWKELYKVENSKGWCELCRRLHDFKPDEQRKYYKDIDQWWNCKPKDGSDNNYLEPACLDIPVFRNEGIYSKLARFFL